jgi:hypothetical protein
MIRQIRQTNFDHPSLSKVVVRRVLNQPYNLSQLLPSVDNPHSLRNANAIN